MVGKGVTATGCAAAAGVAGTGQGHLREQVGAQPLPSPSGNATLRSSWPGGDAQAQRGWSGRKGYGGHAWLRPCLGRRRRDGLRALDRPALGHEGGLSP